MTAVNLSLPIKDAEMLLRGMELISSGISIGCECGDRMEWDFSQDTFPSEEVEHLIAALRISVEAAR